jgi:predicted CopG family antitoxin
MKTTNEILSEVLGKLVKKEGNLGALQIGFGSRTRVEKERLQRELRELEEEDIQQSLEYAAWATSEKILAVTS